MAIIKCSTCGKNVSDETAKCPNCENDLNKAVYCPKCGSADTSVLLKWNGGKYRILAALVFLFDRGISAWRTAEHICEESEYASKVRRVCNDCGKKFKVK